MSKIKKQKFTGFTLIELLMVIATIALLASIVLVSLKGVIEKAKIVKVLKFSQSIQNVLGTDVVGVWTFDDQTNPTKDTSGYGNDGTISGAVFTDDTPHKFVGAGTAQGKYALYFDGNDYVDVGNGSSLNFGINDFTVSSWFKTDNPFDSDIIGKFDGLVGWAIGIMGSYPYFIFGDGTNQGSITYEESVVDGKWHFLTGTRSGNLWSIYLDGNLAAQNTDVVESINVSNPVLIGEFISQGPFQGAIDEVRIYNRALTASEIQKHYAEGKERHKLVEK